MVRCQKCEVLSEEIKFLRGQVKTLTDRLSMIAYPGGFVAGKFTSSDYVGGGGGDQYVGYDEYGQRVLMEKDS